jgi:hypothetical protein
LKKWFRPALLVHATIVAGLFVLLLFLAWTHPDDPPDANIGAGMVALLLGLFGLPWSFLATQVESDPWAVAVLTGAAVVNLGLHGLIASRLRRQGPKPE